MKNYYDELEISKNASKEVIEKVYKVLAKKYHPDATQEDDKQAAEEKFKIISEAYEILSDDEKRKNYDLELEQENPTISYADYIKVVRERDALSNSLNTLKKQFNQSYNNINFTETYTNNDHNNNYYDQSKIYNPQTKKHKYYNATTVKPVSPFIYFCYKIKRLFRNIGILLLVLLVIILAINAFLG